MTLVFRDLFTKQLAAGSLDGTAAEPGTGLREVTDAESKIFTADGRLRGGGQDTPAWGDSKVVFTDAAGNGFARATGRTLVGLLLPEDTIVDADIAFGWASAIDIGDPRTDGLGFLTEDGGEIDVIVPGFEVKLRNNAQWNMRPMQYLIGVTLNDTGAYWWISSFGDVTSAVGNYTYAPIPQYPQAALLWVDRADTTATYFPYIQYYGKIDDPAAGYPNGSSLEDLRILDVLDWSTADALASFADRFTRADSATDVGNDWTADAGGTWGISNNQAYYAAWVSGNMHYVTHETGLADGNGIFTWDITYPTSGTPLFFLFYRYTDENNWYAIHNNSGDYIYLRRCVDGAITDFWGVAHTWTAGQTYHITAHIYGNYAIIAIDNVIQLSSSGANMNYHLTATKFGFGEWYTPHAGQRWDNVAAYPLEITLPSDFSDGMIPTIHTGGSTLAQDTFTGSNGTSLADHSAEAGGAWELDGSSAWIITDNQADPVTPLVGVFHALQDPNTADAEAQVTMTIPDPIPEDSLLTGIVFRYVDDGNYMAARLTHMYYAHNADEVELLRLINDGNGEVLHKINLGAFNEAGDVRTLKVQAYGDLIQVFLQGEPIISYYTTDDDPVGTKWGLHVDRRTGEIQDEGVLFDDWIVKGIASEEEVIAGSGFVRRITREKEAAGKRRVENMTHRPVQPVSGKRLSEDRLNHRRI